MAQKMIFKVDDRLQEKFELEYIQTMAELTGIDQKRLLDIAKQKPVAFIFENTSELNLSPEEKEKIYKLKLFTGKYQFYDFQKSTKEKTSLEDKGKTETEKQRREFDFSKLKNKSSDFKMER